MDVRARKRYESVNVPSPKVPVGICVIAGLITGVLVALVTPSATPSVHAKSETMGSTALSSLPEPIIAPAGRGALTNTTTQNTGARAPRKRLGVFHGLASWYGAVFDGRKTASGERFDKNALTACQPDLPFGSLVRVINRRNKRSVVVRINDRGDLVDERRVIDLSWAAAEKLNMTRIGLAKVDVEVLSLGGGRGKN